MEGETSNDVTDRISQLPEPILQHILSFLEVKDAFRTCVLSKNLNSACATFQFLNFGKFLPPTPTRNIDDLENFLPKSMEALNVVDGILMRRMKLNVGIRKFCLELTLRFDELDLQPFINTFITSVTEGNKIRELVFKAGDYAGPLWEHGDVQPMYTLPEVVYAAESLVKLHLEGFTLGSPLYGTVKFYCLRKLHLSWTFVDDDLFQLLMMGCPQIEFLSTDHIKGLKRVRVCGLPKLKRIRMYNCHRRLFEMEIEAPNLEYLFLHSSGVLFAVDVGSCKNLKHLELHSIAITNKWMVDLLSNLPFLEQFHLSNCLGLKILKVSSDRLKRLSLNSCKNLEEVEVNAPHLCSFRYSGDISLSISLTASPTEETIYRHISPKANGIQFHEKFMEFLRKFNHCKKMMFLSRDCTAELIIPTVLREALHHPLYDIKHLTIGLYRREGMLLDLLDNVLWIAPCLDTLSIYGSSLLKGSQIQFTYGTSINGRREPLLHINKQLPSMDSAPYRKSSS